jgi:integrase
MTVKVRPYRGSKDKWEVDIRFEWPNGETYRERVKAPVSARTGAQRWGEQRERDYLTRGKAALDEQEVTEQKLKQVPTVADFIPRFIEEHCRADRLKPSTLQSNRQALTHNIAPRIGCRRLNEVTNVDIQRIKAEMADKSPKTVNNALCALSVMLKKSIEWGVIDVMPCTIKLLRVTHDERAFYDFDDYERLVTAAPKVDPRIHIAILLGGDAGLRMGEVIALEWGRVNFGRGVLVIAKSEWRGHVSAPKSGKVREVKMTQRLLQALKAHRHLRGDRVLVLDNGDGFNRETLRKWTMRVERVAGLPVTGRFHVLRHTFCSHLAMESAPAKAIQELAGHADLTTTMRYMHLSPSARDSAIEKLDEARRRKGATDPPGRGEMLEKA